MTEESKKRLTKIARQKMALRSSLWPTLDDKFLWMRERSDGWLSVPRAMPLLMQLMDNLSKGKPVSSAYFDLWCRTYDDSFIVGNKAREMAYFSGFTGERAERTWASRIRILADLGFIDVAEGPNGPISYLLIYNPYKVVKAHYKAGRINEAGFNALRQRMIEIGAQDMDKEDSTPEPSKGSNRKSVQSRRNNLAGAKKPAEQNK